MMAYALPRSGQEPSENLVMGFTVAFGEHSFPQQQKNDEKRSKAILSPPFVARQDQRFGGK